MINLFEELIHHFLCDDDAARAVLAPIFFFHIFRRLCLHCRSIKAALFSTIAKVTTDMGGSLAISVCWPSSI